MTDNSLVYTDIYGHVYSMCIYIVHTYLAHQILNSNFYQTYENLTIAQVGMCLYSTYMCLAPNLHLITTHIQNSLYSKTGKACHRT